MYNGHYKVWLLPYTCEINIITRLHKEHFTKTGVKILISVAYVDDVLKHKIACLLQTVQI